MSPTPSTPAQNSGQPLTRDCCIVGGGPAGLMLGLLLARAGVRVTLLEAHLDFDRDFRGDTIHPATLEVLDQIGLADRLHTLPHAKMRSMNAVTAEGTITLMEFGDLRTRFPYIMIMPQVRFLDFLAEEARRYLTFQLILGAGVHHLIEDQGKVCGVRYRLGDEEHEVRASLTLAADGRFSKVRKLIGMEPVGQTPPMDVVWFRLPRKPEDTHDEGALYVGGGRFLVLLGRIDEWQIGYVFPKGGFQKLKAEGLPALQKAVAGKVPWLADRVSVLDDWKHFTVLAVESSRLPCWHKPGLLLIGDAAHVMSPVGGVGINYAIGDAVETVNVLAEKLRTGSVTEADLAEVQRRREKPVRVIQWFQGLLQNRLVKEAIGSARPFRLPMLFRIVLGIPLLRALPARLMAFGIHRVKLERPAAHQG